jgi:ketosteroid isomerase-like protein
MMKNYFGLLILCFVIACNSSTEKKETAAAPAAEKKAVDLPYKAAYAADWTQDVSDEDLKMVLQSYKDWEDNNKAGLRSAFGDSVMVDMADGTHLNTKTDDIVKTFFTYRDSLTSSKIRMQSWAKLYSPEKKDGYVVTWYDQYDTFKSGKIDSATYHDINQVKNGKITWYAQYKRPLK